MTKRRKRKSPEPESATPNNPFGALAGLREELPSAPATPEVSTAPAGSDEIARKTPGGKIVVRRETKGRKGKTVTRVSGLAPSELLPLAKSLKKALGCGASVEGEDLIVLGSLVDRTADWLKKQGAKRVVRSG